MQRRERRLAERPPCPGPPLLSQTVRVLFASARIAATQFAAHRRFGMPPGGKASLTRREKGSRDASGVIVHVELDRMQGHLRVSAPFLRNFNIDFCLTVNRNPGMVGRRWMKGVLKASDESGRIRLAWAKRRDKVQRVVRCS
jgi:hypothetical protein